MITAAEVQKTLKREPFVPFRIITSSGRAYHVHHPEWAMVFRRYVEVGILNPEYPDFPDSSEWVSMLHITALEDVPPSAKTSPKSNGKKK
jgi:hypothetical protein